MPKAHIHPSKSCWNQYQCVCEPDAVEGQRHEGWEACREEHNSYQRDYRQKRVSEASKAPSGKRKAQKRVLSNAEVAELRERLGLTVMNGIVVSKNPQGGAK